MLSEGQNSMTWYLNHFKQVKLSPGEVEELVLNPMIKWKQGEGLHELSRSPTQAAFPGKKKKGLKAKLRQDQYKETQKTQGRSDFLNQKRLLCSLFLSLYCQV